MQTTHDGEGGARRPLDVAGELAALARQLAGPCTADDLIHARVRAALLRREAEAGSEPGLERRARAIFDRAGELIYQVVGPYEDELRDLS